MAILPLVLSPDPRLKEISKPVKQVDDDLRAFMDDMLETMRTCDGLGLAAIQVGRPVRILVMDIARGSQRYDPDAYDETATDPLFLVNPEIIEQSDELFTFDEGCLSFPGQFAAVKRPKRVKVKYLDYHGKQRELEAEGLAAVCVQHEIDHLNGITFVDHVSRMKRDLILRRMKKRERYEDTAS